MRESERKKIGMGTPRGCANRNQWLIRIYGKLPHERIGPDKEPYPPSLLASVSTFNMATRALARFLYQGHELEWTRTRWRDCRHILAACIEAAGGTTDITSDGWGNRILRHIPH